jgi:hypothetical protein
MHERLSKAHISSCCDARKDLYYRVGEPATLYSPRLLISQTLRFGLNVTLTSVFNFVLLLSYHVIRVFLVQKFSCPVGTRGENGSDTDGYH